MAFRHFALTVWMGAATMAQAAPSISGPVLWQGIRAGMSQAQLSKALPGLAPSERPHILAGPETKVVGLPFKVLVETAADRVVGVTLASQIAMASDVAEALTAKYGRATEPFGCKMRLAIHLCTGTWRGAGDVQVRLSQVQAEGVRNTSIRYEVADTSGL